MIKVICPGCGKQFAAKDENLGRKTRCPACRVVLRIEGERTADRPRSAVKTPAPSPAPRGAGSAAISPPVAASSTNTIELADITPPPLPVSVSASEPTFDAPPASVGGAAAPVSSPATTTSTRPIRLANASLGCGCAGLILPGVNVAAIVTGIIALGREEDEATRRRSKPRAMGGIGLGLLGLFLHLLLAMIGAASLMMNSKPAPAPPTVVAVPAPTPAPPPAADQTPLAPLATPTAAPPTTPSPQPTQAFFYDLNTGQLFPADKKLIPAIDAPSGPLPDGTQAGVRAWVFSCGSCAAQSTQFIGWYERMVPSAKKLQNNPDSVSIDEIIEGYSTQFEISVDAKTWEKKHAIVYLQWQLEKRKAMCPQGGFATECHP